MGIQFKFVNEKKHYISNTYTVKSYVVVFFKELYSQNDYKKKKKKIFFEKVCNNLAFTYHVTRNAGTEQ